MPPLVDWLVHVQASGKHRKARTQLDKEFVMKCFQHTWLDQHAISAPKLKPALKSLENVSQLR